MSLRALGENHSDVEVLGKMTKDSLYISGWSEWSSIRPSSLWAPGGSKCTKMACDAVFGAVVEVDAWIRADVLRMAMMRSRRGRIMDVVETSPWVSI
jgi:hypothetical protein